MFHQAIQIMNDEVERTDRSGLVAGARKASAEEQRATALLRLIDQKGQHHEQGQHDRQVLLAVTEIVLELIALVLERVERLALNCEISSLGYPPAALFAFGIGLVAYNILSVVRTAMATAHGEQSVEEISAYYVADEMRGMMRGMMVVISDEQWQRQFGQRTERQMANVLLDLAKQVNLECFRNARRGPKKPRPKRTKYKSKTHVSTARILEESRGRKISSF